MLRSSHGKDRGPEAELWIKYCGNSLLASAWVKGTGWVRCVLREAPECCSGWRLGHCHHLPHTIEAGQTHCHHGCCHHRRLEQRVLLLEGRAGRKPTDTKGGMTWYENDVLSRSIIAASLTTQFPRWCWKCMSLPSPILPNTFSTPLSVKGFFKSERISAGFYCKRKKEIIVLLHSRHLGDFSEKIIKTNEFKHSISIMDSTDPH